MKNPETSPSPSAGDCRCVCGRLAARVVPGGIELKCRRCKRALLVALPRGRAHERPELEIALEREAV